MNPGRLWLWLSFLFWPVGGWSSAPESTSGDPSYSETRNEAEGFASGMLSPGGGQFLYNSQTQRLEVRDSSGAFLDEMAPGTIGKAVDAGNQEYRISFGKDELDRLSILVRPGPAMRRPVSLDLLGRKTVLSPDASLTATLIPDGKVIYEASICGQVYYIDQMGAVQGRVSRQANPAREIAVLAQPSSPTAGIASDDAEPEERFEGMNEAGNAMKSAVLTFFGLPDKEPTTKAKVYRLKGSSPGAPVGPIPVSGASAP